jgi:hypothetical protein
MEAPRKGQIDIKNKTSTLVQAEDQQEQCHVRTRQIALVLSTLAISLQELLQIVYSLVYKTVRIYP